MEIWDGRTKKQSTRRLNNRNYSILRTERKELKKNEQRLWKLWGNIKYTSTCVTGVLEGEKRKREKIFE